MEYYQKRTKELREYQTKKNSLVKDQGHIQCRICSDIPYLFSNIYL